MDRPDLIGNHGCDRLQLCKQFQARLCLPSLRGLGAESVNEGGEPLPLRFLFLGELEIERLTLTALAFEGGIAAAIERELAGFQVEDPVHRAIEEIAIMAD